MTLGDGALDRLIIVGLVVPLFSMWLVAYVDIARRRDLQPIRKALWAGVIFFAPYVGIVAYMAVRPVTSAFGAGGHQTTPRSSVLVADIESLRQDHHDGVITDEHYLSRKRQLLGLT